MAKIDFSTQEPLAVHEQLAGVRTFLAALEIEAAYVTTESQVCDFCDAATDRHGNARYGNAKLTLDELGGKLGVPIADEDLVVDVLARMRKLKV